MNSHWAQAEITPIWHHQDYFFRLDKEASHRRHNATVFSGWVGSVPLEFMLLHMCHIFYIYVICFVGSLILTTDIPGEDSRQRCCCAPAEWIYSTQCWKARSIQLNSTDNTANRRTQRQFIYTHKNNLKIQIWQLERIEIHKDWWQWSVHSRPISSTMNTLFFNVRSASAIISRYTVVVHMFNIASWRKWNFLLFVSHISNLKHSWWH